MSISIVAAGSLTTSGGQYVAAYFDGEQRAKSYFAAGSVSAPFVANGFPSTVSVTQTSIVDSAGNTKTGGFLVKITPAAADTTNSNSPQTVYVDQNAVFLIASTNNG